MTDYFAEIFRGWEPGETRPLGVILPCNHNCIPTRKWFRRGWVCVRCHRFFRVGSIHR